MNGGGVRFSRAVNAGLENIYNNLMVVLDETINCSYTKYLLLLVVFNSSIRYLYECITDIF